MMIAAKFMCFHTITEIDYHSIEYKNRLEYWLDRKTADQETLGSNYAFVRKINSKFELY